MSRLLIGRHSIFVRAPRRLTCSPRRGSLDGEEGRGCLCNVSTMAMLCFRIALHGQAPHAHPWRLWINHPLCSSNALPQATSANRAKICIRPLLGRRRKDSASARKSAEARRRRFCLDDIARTLSRLTAKDIENRSASGHEFPRSCTAPFLHRNGRYRFTAYL